MPRPLLGQGLNSITVLRHHLAFNHYPPVDPAWDAPAQAAIDTCVSHASLIDGEGFDRGVEYDDLDFLMDQVPGTGITVQQLMDDLHLWDFVFDALVLIQDEAEGDED